jgi:hypothetical protein
MASIISGFVKLACMIDLRIFFCNLERFLNFYNKWKKSPLGCCGRWKLFIYYLIPAILRKLCYGNEKTAGGERGIMI